MSSFSYFYKVIAISSLQKPSKKTIVFASFRFFLFYFTENFNTDSKAPVNIAWNVLQNWHVLHSSHPVLLLFDLENESYIKKYKTTNLIDDMNKFWIKHNSCDHNRKAQSNIIQVLIIYCTFLNCNYFTVHLHKCPHVHLSK